jgi:rubredoxin
MLASVSTSACSPAPPDGSVAAKARTIGGWAWGLSTGSVISMRDHRQRRQARRLARMGFYSKRAAPMKKYMCLICGWLYDEAAGAPEDGIAPGTRWEDVPPNWTCPECGARKEDFEMAEF